MDYVYLPIDSGFRIKRDTLIAVLGDIIGSEDENVDMREIGARYGLNRCERRAVEDFLLKYMVFDKTETFKAYKTLAKGILEVVESGAFKAVRTETTEKDGNSDFGPIAISISLLQRQFGISFPLAAKIFDRLDERGLIIRDGNKKYFDLGTPPDDD